MAGPQLSEIEILPVKPHDGLVAFASCVVNDQLYLGDIAIYTRPGGGYRLVYPAKVLPNGKRINCVHPITREAGDAIERAILAKFDELTKKSEQVMTTEGGCADEPLPESQAPT